MYESHGFRTYNNLTRNIYISAMSSNASNYISVRTVILVNNIKMYGFQLA